MEKKSFYEKSSKIKNTFFKDSSFNDCDMIETIRKAQKCLKDIDTINTRGEIAVLRYGHSTIPGCLWQSEAVYNFYLFATMLGFIDARVDDYKSKIAFYSNFLDNLENDEDIRKTIKSYKSLFESAILDREAIISDYHEFGTFDHPFGNIADDTLTTFPCYLKFTNIYKDAAENHYSLSLQQQLISAYNIGYIDWDGDYNKKLNEYKELVLELRKCKEKNKEWLETERKNNKTLEIVKMPSSGIYE